MTPPRHQTNNNKSLPWQKLNFENGADKTILTMHWKHVSKAANVRNHKCSCQFVVELVQNILLNLLTLSLTKLNVEHFQKWIKWFKMLSTSKVLNHNLISKLSTSDAHLKMFFQQRQQQKILFIWLSELKHVVKKHSFE